MEIRVKSVAGTLESSDVYVLIEPSENLEVILKSTVLDQYENEIRTVISETLKEMNISKAKITLDDKGALNEVIKSRLQTAIMRACQSKEYKF